MSTRSIYSGETPRKPAHAFTYELPSPSKATMAGDRVRPFMAAKNGGGDPVTALAYRTETASSSEADRRAAAQNAIADTMARLEG